ncbi:MAG TPA: hypothetical protein VMV45_14600 [Casimicrobiaceae bacterium]|nr:hypothetical protein [Casimicrobiaceae bacterium]
MDNQKDKGKDQATGKQQQAENVHGEGNYAASRQYNAGVHEHMQSHDVDKEARDAAPRSADEAREMESAEAKGKQRAKEEDPALRRRATGDQRGPEEKQTPKPGQE